MARKQEPASSVGWWWIAAGLVALSVVGLLWLYRESQPQLTSDDAVFNTVDALFTAVTSRDASRVAACEKNLKSYAAAGRVPAAASAVLDQVVQQTKEGQWEPAAKRLYAFMLAQRRDEEREAHP